MTTFANECRAAGLNGITALLADIRLDTSANAELAVLPLSWAGASVASPAVAVATATADSSPTAGTIAKFILRTGGAATRINGSVGTSGTDIVVTDNVIPGGTTSVSMPGGLSMSLSLA